MISPTSTAAPPEPATDYNYIDWTHKNTELRYWLGAGFEGHGLATKACRALIEHALVNWACTASKYAA